MKTRDLIDIGWLLLCLFGTLSCVFLYGVHVGSSVGF